MGRTGTIEACCRRPRLGTTGSGQIRSGFRKAARALIARYRPRVNIFARPRVNRSQSFVRIKTVKRPEKRANCCQRGKNNIRPSGPADSRRIISPEQVFSWQSSRTRFHPMRGRICRRPVVVAFRAGQNFANIDFRGPGLIRGLRRHPLQSQQKLFRFWQKKPEP